MSNEPVQFAALIQDLEETKAGLPRNAAFYRGVISGIDHAIDVVRRAARYATAEPLPTALDDPNALPKVDRWEAYKIATRTKE